MIGIDEVGRGCWAGPLLVVAYRQTSKLPTGVGDSKSVSKKRRQALQFDLEIAGDIGEGWVSNQEIDAAGLTGAMRLGVARALEAITAGDDEPIIMDGAINYCSPNFTNVQTVIDGDALYPVVGAASITAKVRRDASMAALAKDYESYGFERHVGYGTAAHLAALKVHGVCDLHRLSFKPVKAFVEPTS